MTVAKSNLISEVDNEAERAQVRFGPRRGPGAWTRHALPPVSRDCIFK